MDTTNGTEKDKNGKKDEQIKKEMTQRKIMGDTGNRLTVEETRMVLNPKPVRELMTAFRPARTLSRSPVRYNDEIAMANVDLTGDEEDENENVFTDASDRSKGSQTAVIKDHKQTKEETEIKYEETTGGVGLSLTAICQIIEMLQRRNETVSCYLQRVKNVNPDMKHISVDMGKELAQAKELARAAAKAYQKEKCEEIERTRRIEEIYKQQIENTSIDRSKPKSYGEGNNENLNKRKNVTPPEPEISKKKSKTNAVSNRLGPMIRSVQIIREANDEASSDSDWSMINRRRKRTDKKEKLSREETETGEDDRKLNQRSTKPPPKRGEAITIKVGKGNTYAEVTKSLKNKMGNDIEGVKRIRETRTGDLLVEFNEKTDSSVFRDQAIQALGAGAEVRRLIPKTKIEILDIDPSAEAEEIIGALVRDTGIRAEDIFCKSLRKAYMGTQVGIIEGPIDLQEKIKENKIRIGRCGKEGHNMAECNAEKSQCRLCIAKGLTGNSAAQALLEKTVQDTGADIVIISEQNRSMNYWYGDTKGDAAIWITDLGIRKATKLNLVKQGKGLVAINYNEYLIISNYISPNIDNEELDDRLKEVRDIIIAKKWAGVLWAGDLNAKSPLWGGNAWNPRGKKVIREIINAELIPVITEGGNTCTRGNGSKIDIIIISTNLEDKMRESRVLGTYTGSDHQYVWHRVDLQTTRPETKKKKEIKKDIDAKLLIKKFQEKYQGKVEEGFNEQININDIKKFVRELEDLCNSSRKNRGKSINRKPVYWWNEEIANLRKITNKNRRKLTRSRKKGNVEAIKRVEEKYKEAKKSLKREIGRAKKEVWEKFIDSVDRDIWGKPYKAVIRQIKPEPPPVVLNLEQTREVIKGLFIMKQSGIEEGMADAGHEGNNVMKEQEYKSQNNMEDLEISTDDVIRAGKRIMIKKAPGPDGIPALAARVIGINAARWLQQIFNSCLKIGYWPDQWKETRLVLLPKGKKKIVNSIRGEKINPSDYRPLCIASNMAKIFEHVIKDKLLEELDKDGLSENQYGFRKGRSTVHAMDTVMGLWDGAKREGRHCLLILLDVKNAFNTLRWRSIIEAMRKKNFNPQMVGLIRSYLTNRWLIVNTSDGTDRIQVFGGVPQGSVIGPFMWNLVYDGLLKKTIRRDVYLIAFADDVGIIIIEKDLETIKIIANEVMKDILTWFQGEGLELAPQKSESILLTGRKCVEGIPVKINEEEIKISEKAKYLGVIFETNQVFKEHIKNTMDRALKYAICLGMLQSNIRGAENVEKPNNSNKNSSTLTMSMSRVAGHWYLGRNISSP
ncbi:uncharacterized protein LOC114881785 [Osmia bicornis bicornis]|uniref:uncharacterized protein LOC114881785 n=1 Tax=Osmia bicornis bicornis TaxID=1437191 RepID=UPI0010F46219|nr:uncharacterized protein LOC114881785 [Osmia bicornis bicornis]